MIHYQYAATVVLMLSNCLSYTAVSMTEKKKQGQKDAVHICVL